MSPQQIRDAARAPDRGVILGTDDRDRSTLVPLAVQPTPVRLAGGAIATAGTGPAGVSVGGTGSAAWRQSAWTGAIAAAALLDKDVGALGWTVETSDAPAPPGGVMAAAFVASLTGAKSGSAAAPLGPVHPDGTVGTGPVIDLVAAYGALTGEELPATLPLAESEMMPSEHASSTLSAAYETRRRWLSERWSRVVDLLSEAAVASPVTELARAASAQASAAETLRRAGDAAGAHIRIARAAALADAALRTQEIVEAARAGERQRAASLLSTALDAGPPVGSAFEAGPTAQDGGTIGSHLRRISALDLALAGWARLEQGAPALESARKALGQWPARSAAAGLADQIAPAIAIVSEARAAAELTIDVAAAERDASPPLAIDPAAISALATPYASAAAATVELVAAQTPSLAAVSLRFSTDEPAAPLRKRADAGAPAPLLPLAAAIHAYLSSSLDVALLDVSDPAARADRLARLVTAAELAARRHARAARVAAGYVPAQAILRYRAAMALRTDDPAVGLQLLWSSSLYSQLAIALARNQPSPTVSPVVPTRGSE